MKRMTLCLLFALSLALLLASCKTQTPTETEDSSSESSQESFFDSLPEESSEPVAQNVYMENFFANASEIPAARADLKKRALTESDPEALRTFCETYTGTFPAIADVICTEKDCFACAVYEVTDGQVLFDWISVDRENGKWKQGQSETPTPYAYDKNAYNQSGSFFLEPAPASGSYILHYRENGEDRVLFTEEKEDVNARIIRQTDDFAVLSLLKNEERSYLLVDRSGRVISDMDWVADVSMISPLMFGNGVLYCKTDADEDYVYDTVGEIDLQTGEYRDLLTVGNCDYWTYFADGSGIVMYADDHSNAFLYFDTASGSLQTVTLGGTIASLELTNDCVYGTLSDTELQLFVWDVASEKLFGAPCSSELRNGSTIFAAFTSDRLNLYSIVR